MFSWVHSDSGSIVVSLYGNVVFLLSFFSFSLLSQRIKWDRTTWPVHLSLARIHELLAMASFDLQDNGNPLFSLEELCTTIRKELHHGKQFRLTIEGCRLPWRKPRHPCGYSVLRRCHPTLLSILRLARNSGHAPGATTKQATRRKAPRKKESNAHSTGDLLKCGGISSTAAGVWNPVSKESPMEIGQGECNQNIVLCSLRLREQGGVQMSRSTSTHLKPFRSHNRQVLYFKKKKLGKFPKTTKLLPLKSKSLILEEQRCWVR